MFHHSIPFTKLLSVVTISLDLFFCDGGSNATYATHRAAERIQAKKLGKVTLDVTTMGNVEKTLHTQQYEFTLRTKTGKMVTVTAYGMDQITGPVNKFD